MRSASSLAPNGPFAAVWSRTDYGANFPIGKCEGAQDRVQPCGSAPGLCQLHEPVSNRSDSFGPQVPQV